MIGKRIKERRIELGLSQEELAYKLGYTSRSTINKVELGKSDVTQSKVVEYAKALDTTPAYLMGWEDDEKLRILTEQITNERKPCDDLIEYIQDLNEDEVQSVIKYILFLKSQR